MYDTGGMPSEAYHAELFLCCNASFSGKIQATARFYCYHLRELSFHSGGSDICLSSYVITKLMFVQ